MIRKRLSHALVFFLLAIQSLAGCATAPAADSFADVEPAVARLLAAWPPYCLETPYHHSVDGWVGASKAELTPSTKPLYYRQRNYSSYPVSGADLIAQFAAMEAAGLLVPMRPGETPPDPGPSRWWRLTDEARKYQGQYAGEICWGRRTLVSTKVTRKPRKIGCMVINDVTYSYRFDGVPAWAQTEGFKAAFPRAPTVDGEMVEVQVSMARVLYPDKTVRWSVIEFGPHSNILC